MGDTTLFPRGKTASAEHDGREESKLHQGSATVKRKAAGPSEDKDFLFGSKPTKSKPNKRARTEDGEESSKQQKTLTKIAGEVGAGMLVQGRPARLELISFKKLAKGSLLLGVVQKVDPSNVTVSLPSGLTGVVHRPEVSDHFHVQALHGKAGGKPLRYHDEGAQREEVALSSLFHEGQVLRCVVLSAGKDGKGQKRVELSTRPSLVNKGLTLDQLAEGLGVYGAVTSVEDHGCVVSLGMEGVHAFINTRDAVGPPLKVGQPCELVIKKLSSGSRTVTLSNDPEAVASAITRGGSFNLRSLKCGMLVEGMVDSVVANGMLINFLGYFAGGIDHNHLDIISDDASPPKTATPPKAGAAAGWKAVHRPGTKVRARVLMVDYAAKAIRLTMRPHLMAFKGPEGLPPHSTVIEGAEVVRVDPGIGVLLRIPAYSSGEPTTEAGSTPKAEAGKATSGKQGKKGKKGKRSKGDASAPPADLEPEAADVDDDAAALSTRLSGPTVCAYVHISRVADKGRTEHVEKMYKPGQSVKCRVVGASLVEGWAAASLKPSVVDAAVVKYSDVKPGEVLQGQIITIEDFGMLVSLGEGVRGLVTNMHLSDNALKKPNPKHKVDATVSVRVLTVDPEAKRIQLTLKKSLLRDPEPLLSYEDAEKGRVVTGFITKVGSFGIVVTFYNNVYGLVPAKSMAKLGVEDPEEAYKTGQVVRCVAVRPDPQAKKLLLSLDVAGRTKKAGEDGASDAESEAEAEYVCPHKDGDLVDGVVKAVEGTFLRIKLPNCRIDGMLPKIHLCDHASFADALARGIKVGDQIPGLLVLEVNKRGAPTLTKKPLLLAAHANAAAASSDDASSPFSHGGTVKNVGEAAVLPSSAENLTVGDVVAGFVSKAEEFGVFVRFRSGLSALCPKALIADQFVKDARGFFVEGDSVRCVVQRVDLTTGRVSVSLKPSAVPATSTLYLQTLLAEMALAAKTLQADGADGEEAPRPLPDWNRYPVGTTTDATVAALKDYGVVLTAGDEATLMVCPPHQSQEGVSEGDKVKVRVLGVDLERRLLDVTMQPELVKAGRSKRRKAAQPLEPRQRVVATVELAGKDAHYAVASVDGVLALVLGADYHCPYRKMQQEAPLQPGKTFEGIVRPPRATTAEALQDDPHAGLASLIPVGSTGLQAREKRKAAAKEKAKTPKEPRPKGLWLRAVTRHTLRPGKHITVRVSAVRADQLDVRIPLKSGKDKRGRSQSVDSVASAMSAGSLEGGEEEEAEQAKTKPVSSDSHDSAEDDSSDEEKEGSRTGAPTQEGEHPDESAEDDTAVAGGGQNAGEATKGDEGAPAANLRVRSRVHVTQAGASSVTAPLEGPPLAAVEAETLPQWHPFAEIKVGQLIRVCVVSVEEKEGSLFVELSTDPDLLPVTADGSVTALPRDHKPALPMSWEEDHGPLPQVGGVHRGVITKAEDAGVVVALSPTVHGIVPLMELSTDEATLKDHRRHYHAGMGIQVRVAKVDASRHRLRLAPDLPSKEQTEKPSKRKRARAVETDATPAGGGSPPKAGDIVLGRLALDRTAPNPPAVSVEVSGCPTPGRVCITEIADRAKWREGILGSLEDGAMVRCRVLSNKGGRLDLSMRPSRLAESVTPQQAIGPEPWPLANEVVTGFVADTSKSGCFVRLGREVTGRVLLKDLADTFVGDPEREFPRGRLVAARVLASDQSKKELKLSLKLSAVSPDGKYLTYDQVKPGMKLKGVVKTVQPYGLFIQVEGSDVVGMCHRSEVADHEVEDPTSAYEPGDYVKALVLKCQAEQKRVFLGLKASYFEGDPDSDDDSDVEAWGDVDDAMRDEDELASVPGLARNVPQDTTADPAPEGKRRKRQRKQSVEEPLEEEEPPAEREPATKAKGRKRVQRVDPSEAIAPLQEDSADAAGTPSERKARKRQRKRESEQTAAMAQQAQAAALMQMDSDDEDGSSTPGGLFGGQGPLSSGGLGFQLKFDDFDAGTAKRHPGSDEDSDSDQDEEDHEASSKGHKSRAKAAERKKEEERISAREKALMADDAEPETANDYERLLMGEPNSSFLWVKYMAFQLSLADVEAARAVGERALKTILFREEQERMNVWVALLNLEHKYGSKDSLQGVLQRALQNAHPKRVYLHLVQVYEKAGQQQEAEEVFKAMCKKFKPSKKMWMAYQLFRLQSGDDAGARELLQRSLQSLAKHKHIPVISRFAQNEYEFGSRERGRTIFEGLLSSYPKRLDLWNIYIDKEIKAGDLPASRQLFERLVHMDFNPKRMKGVFKKYLNFELDHGNDETAEAVRDKARAYVASLA